MKRNLKKKNLQESKKRSCFKKKRTWRKDGWKRSPNTDKNLRLANAEQLEFDFNKLGGKPDEKGMQAKQQRDEYFKKQREQKEDNKVKEVLTIDHTRLSEEENYSFPSIDLLGKPKGQETLTRRQ